MAIPFVRRKTSVYALHLPKSYQGIFLFLEQIRLVEPVDFSFYYLYLFVPGIQSYKKWFHHSFLIDFHCRLDYFGSSTHSFPDWC